MLFSYMKKPVSVKLKFSIDDIIRVVHFHQNQSFIFRYDVAITGSMVFLAFATAIVVMANDFNEINVLSSIIFSAIPAIAVAISVYFLHKLLYPWLAKRRVTKYFKSSPIMHDEILVEFLDEGIKSTGKLSSSLVAWGAIVKAVESKTDLIFYTGPAWPGLHIAKKAFDSDEDLDSVKVLLQQTLNEKAVLQY